jgi:hypothetical protein
VPKITGQVVALVLLIILGIGAPGAAYVHERIDQANDSVAQTHLANLESLEQTSIATSGTYATSLAQLEDNDLGSVVTELNGIRISYVAPATGTNFIMAQRLPQGGYFLVGDHNKVGLVCKTYTPKCVSHVTTDASLAAAKPVWTRL